MCMEQVFSVVGEKTVIGASFLMMLYYVMVKFSGVLEGVSSKIDTIVESNSSKMTDISTTLLKIDMRLEGLEGRIERLEGDKK